VAVDKIEAVKWYRQAAEKVHAQAQYALGCCHYYGDGAPLDKAEAAKWFQKAADQGHANAKAALNWGKENKE
jgi:TPR repeat protein